MIRLRSRKGVAAQEEMPERSGAERRRATPVELALMLLISVLVMFGLVRPFVVEVFHIPSESMSPTLEAGDRVLAAKFAYRLGEPNRGDLAVFESESGVAIKRVVGLPGDRVEIRDGVLFINGERRREPYVDYGLTDSNFYGPIKVPEGHVFVLGDNRSNSRDSRAFGPVPLEDLEGRALLRVWPLSRAGTL